MLALIARMFISSQSGLDAPEDEVDAAEKENFVKQRSEARFDDAESQRNDDHQESSEGPFGARHNFSE